MQLLFTMLMLKMLPADAAHLLSNVMFVSSQWRSQKFSTGGALISGFPSYPHNHLLIYLIHYVTKYFSEKYVRIMRKICLDDSCLNHLTNIPIDFTRKSSYIHTFWEITYQKHYVFCWQGVRTQLTQLVSLRHRKQFAVRARWKSWHLFGSTSADSDVSTV